MQRYIIELSPKGEFILPKEVLQKIGSCRKVRIRKVRGHFEMTLPDGSPIRGTNGAMK